MLRYGEIYLVDYNILLMALWCLPSFNDVLYWHQWSIWQVQRSKLCFMGDVSVSVLSSSCSRGGIGNSCTIPTYLAVVVEWFFCLFNFWKGISFSKLCNWRERRTATDGPRAGLLCWLRPASRRLKREVEGLEPTPPKWWWPKTRTGKHTTAFAHGAILFSSSGCYKAASTWAVTLSTFGIFSKSYTVFNKHELWLSLLHIVNRPNM